jgi:hypothetical protein
MIERGLRAEKVSNLEEKRDRLRKQIRRLKSSRVPDQELLSAKEVQLAKVEEELINVLKQATGKDVTSIDTALFEFHEEMKGQKRPPMFRNLPIFCYAACGLHMYMAISRGLFWATYDKVDNTPAMRYLLKELKKLNLQYIHIFTRKFRDAKSGDRENMGNTLNLIGRDCRVLELKMLDILDDFVATPIGQQMTELIEPLRILWAK